MRDFSSTRPLASDDVDRSIVETREKVNHHYQHDQFILVVWEKGCGKSSLSVDLYHSQHCTLRLNSCSSFSILMICSYYAMPRDFTVIN